MRQFLTILIIIFFFNFLAKSQWIYKSNGLPNSSAMEGIVESENFYISTIHYGVYKSADKGENWTSFNVGLPTTNIRTLVKSNLLYACTGGKGVYFYNDIEKKWMPDNLGLDNAFIFSYLNTGTVSFAGSDQGIYLQNSPKTIWTKNTKVLETSSIFCFYQNFDKVYAGSGGIYSTIDNGKTWAMEVGIAPTIAVYSIINFKNILYAGTSNGLFYFDSLDNSWKTVPNNINVGIITLAKSNNYLLAGTVSIGIMKISNQGQNWEDFNQGLNSSRIGSLYINSEYVYVGTYKDLGFAKRPLSELEIITSNQSEINSDSETITFIYNKISIHNVFSNNCLYEIWDLNGKKIMVGNIIDRGGDIDLISLKKGIYTFKLISDAKIITKKFNVDF